MPAGTPAKCLLPVLVLIFVFIPNSISITTTDHGTPSLRFDRPQKLATIHPHACRPPRRSTAIHLPQSSHRTGLVPTLQAPNPVSSTTTTAVAATPADPIPAKPELPDLVKRFADGESLNALGHEFGVTHVTIAKWILSAVGDEHYPEVVTSSLIRRIAEADHRLDNAADAVSVARAREQARFARMDLERRRPALYGAKAQAESSVQPILHITVVAAPHAAVLPAQSVSVTIDGTSHVIDSK